MCAQATVEIPSWALPVYWEDAEDTTFHQVDDTMAFTIYQHTPCFMPVVSYVGRLFINQVLVAALKVLGPGNFDMQSANVLCNIEVRPGHRGHRYSVRLMDLVRAEIGVIYRTGMVSVSGLANAKYLNLPLVPGHKLRSTGTPEYHLIDWTTGELLR